MAKDAIEPSSGGAGFYSKIFVVPKGMGGLYSILHLKHFNCYIHIPTFKIPTNQTGKLLVQPGDYAFLMVSRMHIHVPIDFYGLFGATNIISGRFCLLFRL